MESIPTIVDCLRTRATSDPSQIAFTFLRDGERDEIHWTMSRLDADASRIGATLRASLARGDRVLLVYPPGPEFVSGFFGCLYAGMVAVPAYPPRPHQSLKTIEAIVADSGSRTAITTPEFLATIQRRLGTSATLANLRWLTGKDSSQTADVEPVAVPPDDVAYLQYTSGSTGTPKGVIVTHANLMHNSRMMKEGLGNSDRTVYVGWLPLFHDMGLVGLALQSVYLGVRCVLFPAVYFLQKPVRWLQAIDRYRATTTGAPNFAYDLCVRSVKAGEREALDLRTWKVAFNAAEPVRAETLDRFVETFGTCGFRREAFYPCYGLAESVVFVTGGSPDALPIVQRFDAVSLEQGTALPVTPEAPAGRELVACGYPRLGQRIAIVDPDSRRRCAGHRVGEIWVTGPSVAAGYWNRPEDTDHVFTATLIDDDDRAAFLRTGDLGFVYDGQLFIAGRLKDVIIIRGSNYYPHDIEATVDQAHAALQPNCGAAFAVDSNGDPRLIVVQELQRSFRTSATVHPEIIGDIRQAVAAEHGLRADEIILIKTGTIPRTTSGKIRRGACREQFETGTLEVWARG